MAGLSQSATSAEARFPGLNGKIVCEGGRGPAPAPPGVSRSEIFSINPDGTGETLLTNNTVADRDPVFSPDGKRIAFESTRSGGSQIYVGNADGNLNGPDVRRLTTAPGGNRQPSWSPDGTQLAFHSGRPAEFPAPTGTVPDFEIYKMSSTAGEENGPAQRLTTSRGQDAIPAWSPDGSKIAFQSLRESTATRTQDLEIFTMNPDGSGVTNVTNSHGTANDPTTMANENSNALDSTPTWSPDSRFITFGSTRDSFVPGNQNFEVYKINRDGSTPTRLTRNLSGDTPFPQPFQDYDHIPSWSPDGTRIIFHSGRTSTAAGDEIVAYTMDSTLGEAGGLQRLAPTGAFAKCDWQSLRPAAAPRYPGPYPGPPAAPSAACPPASSASAIRGTAAANRITGTLGADRIFAAGGDDVVDALAGNDCVDLGTGADRGEGGPGGDQMAGGRGKDRISGGSGNDRLRGGQGNDRLTPGRGNDRAFGDAGNDLVLGAFGNDVLHGVSGNDRLSGSRGRDRVNGGSGNDRIAGGSSPDRISGDRGNDRLNGNSGSDRIKGNSGSDRIKARDGKRDRVDCGTGRDRVVADRGDRVARNCERVRRVGRR